MFHGTTEQFLVSVSITIYFFFYFNLDDYMFKSTDHQQAIFTKQCADDGQMNKTCSQGKNNKKK